MNWELAGKIALNLILWPVEYLLKFTSTVAAAIVLGTAGPFSTKVASGFGSLIPTIRQLFDVPERLTQIATVIYDYNTLTAANFNERYGGQAVNRVLQSLNEGVLYFQEVYRNLTIQPLSTVIATILVFLVLYMSGRVVRFTRQKGQGSIFNRMERRLGDRIFY